MLYKLGFWKSIFQQIIKTKAFPYISLLIWIVPLLLFNSGESSLMAHDEGLYAWRARQMYESGNWIAGWGNIQSKSPGLYWLIGSFYKIFGVNEFSVRFPSIICSIFCIFLVYKIGKLILNQSSAYLAAIILNLEFLWLQYSRLGNPDLPTILLVLLAIYSFIQAETNTNHKNIYIFIAGCSLGLGFLMRSYMIFLPIVALLPYLIFAHRRYRLLTNPYLYLGWILGLIPTLVWLWLNWQIYKINAFADLFFFIIKLGSEERPNSGIFFYFLNVSANSFPWIFIAFLGLILVICRALLPYQLILIGFPTIFFLEISIFSTRLSHYSLYLYPFIALLAAVGLEWLAKGYEITDTTRKNLFHKQNIARFLSYGCGGLGVMFLLASIIVFVWNIADRNYGIIGLAIALSWFIVPIVWISRHQFGQKWLTGGYWIAGWLIPCWLGFSLAGGFGLLGDYNPVYRTFFQQPAIASILQNHPIYFVRVEDKNSILLNFYTPIHAQKLETIDQIPPSSFAWVDKNRAPASSKPYQVIGEVRNYQLIQALR